MSRLTAISPPRLGVIGLRLIWFTHSPLLHTGLLQLSTEHKFAILIFYLFKVKKIEVTAALP
jgi:hypothetical protein